MLMQVMRMELLQSRVQGGDNVRYNGLIYQVSLVMGNDQFKVSQRRAGGGAGEF